MLEQIVVLRLVLQHRCALCACLGGQPGQWVNRYWRYDLGSLSFRVDQRRGQFGEHSRPANRYQVPGQFAVVRVEPLIQFLVGLSVAPDDAVLVIEGDHQVEAAIPSLAIGQVALSGKNPTDQLFIHPTLQCLLLLLGGSGYGRFVGGTGVGLATCEQQGGKSDGECVFEHDDPCTRGWSVADVLAAESLSYSRWLPHMRFIRICLGGHREHHYTITMAAITPDATPAGSTPAAKPPSAV